MERTYASGDEGFEESSDAELASFLRGVAAMPVVAPPAPEPDRFGQRLGRYEILRRLGAGGMGVVYLAYDARLGRRVALKVLPVRMVADEERRGRFLREARSASAVHHPNVATVFDAGEADDTVYLAMEYIEGRTLRDLLDAHDGKLDVRTVSRLGVQLARALGAAHAAGVVHRDVKPENVMVDPRRS